MLHGLITSQSMRIPPDEADQFLDELVDGRYEQAEIVYKDPRVTFTVSSISSSTETSMATSVSTSTSTSTTSAQVHGDEGLDTGVGEGMHDTDTEGERQGQEREQRDQASDGNPDVAPSATATHAGDVEVVKQEHRERQTVEAKDN